MDYGLLTHDQRIHRLRAMSADERRALYTEACTEPQLMRMLHPAFLRALEPELLLDLIDGFETGRILALGNGFDERKHRIQTIATGAWTMDEPLAAALVERDRSLIGQLAQRTDLPAAVERMIATGTRRTAQIELLRTGRDPEALQAALHPHKRDRNPKRAVWRFVMEGRWSPREPDAYGYLPDAERLPLELLCADVVLEQHALDSRLLFAFARRATDVGRLHLLEGLQGDPQFDEVALAITRHAEQEGHALSEGLARCLMDRGSELTRQRAAAQTTLTATVTDDAEQELVTIELPRKLLAELALYADPAWRERLLQAAGATLTAPTAGGLDDLL